MDFNLLQMHHAVFIILLRNNPGRKSIVAKPDMDIVNFGLNSCYIMHEFME